MPLEPPVGIAATAAATGRPAWSANIRLDNERDYPEAWRDRLAEHGSIVRLVDQLPTPERGLRPLEDAKPTEDQLVWLRTIADPERPLEAKLLLDELERYVRRKPEVGQTIAGLAAAAVMVGLVVLLALAGR